MSNHEENSPRGGPQSQAGKLNASKNSLKHGLRAKKLLLPGESLSEFNKLCSEIRTPNEETGLGRILSDQVGISLWRLRRLYRLECRILENQMLSNTNDLSIEFLNLNNPLKMNEEGYGFSKTLEVSSMDTFIRYNEILERSFYKNVELLLRFRERK